MTSIFLEMGILKVPAF